VTEKTSEQIERERDAVKAMVNARTNMAAVLERVATLEAALANAGRAIKTLKSFISPEVYRYGNDNKPCIQTATDALVEIAKALP
jgi:hypothetical protein